MLASDPAVGPPRFLVVAPVGLPLGLPPRPPLIRALLSVLQMVCERSDAFASACALARAFPLFTHRSGAARRPEKKTVVVEFFLVGQDNGPVEVSTLQVGVWEFRPCPHPQAWAERPSPCREDRPRAFAQPPGRARAQDSALPSRCLSSTCPAPGPSRLTTHNAPRRVHPVTPCGALFHVLSHLSLQIIPLRPGNPT